MDTRLRLLQELIRNLAGKNTEIIAELLIDKKDVNEFKLAEKLKLTINQTRNILYKLYAQNIIFFIRKKDKSKGWYVYYYTLNTRKAFEKLIHLKKKEIEILQNQLNSRETKAFFSCPRGCLELNEETALHQNFLCPECEQLLQLTPNEKLIADIKEKIGRIEKEIAVAQAELDIIVAKEEKQKEKKAKRKGRKIKKKAEKKVKGKTKAKAKKKIKKNTKKTVKKTKKAKKAKFKKKKTLKKAKGKKK